MLLQGLKLTDLSHIHYQGDCMQRPITSNEIGWLVRLLVWLSVFLNRRLHLGSACTGGPNEPDLLVRNACQQHFCKSYIPLPSGCYCSISCQHVSAPCLLAWHLLAWHHSNCSASCHLSAAGIRCCLTSCKCPFGVPVLLQSVAIQ